MGVIRDKLRKKTDDDEDDYERVPLRAIIPFLYFDCSTEAGRREYVDNIKLGKLGGLLGFVPFIIVMAVGCTDPIAACWSGFGLMVFNMSITYYHSTYGEHNPPRAEWLSFAQLCAFFGLGIAFSTESDTECHLISPVMTSTLLIACLISMFVCYPFTMQIAKQKVSKEIAESAGFFKLNMLLTAIWLVLFAIMATCAWVGYVYFRSDTSSWQYIVLQTVVPILLPIMGMLLMPLVAKAVMAKAKAAGAAAAARGEADQYENNDAEANDAGGEAESLLRS